MNLSITYLNANVWQEKNILQQVIIKILVRHKLLGDIKSSSDRSHGGAVDFLLSASRSHPAH
jgi:hypothetical protein